MYGALEDAYDPPRRDHDRRHRAPPVQYYLNDDDDTMIDGFAAFTPRLSAVDWPATFKPAINEKYDGRSDPTIWLKTYSTVVKAANGTYDQMAAYFPMVMGPAPLLWVENLPPNNIDSRGQLARAFTQNYQATYNRPSNMKKLSQVRQRIGETIREYANRFFENRNRLADVEDCNIIMYFHSGLMNRTMFCKMYEAAPKTVG